MPSYFHGKTDVTITGRPQSMQRAEGTNEVFFPGVEHNNGRRPLLIVAENQAVVVVKIPGHKYWDGNGSPWASAPAVYVVFLKVGNELLGHKDDLVMEIIETPVRTSVDRKEV
jgi:hypothetical protein